MRGKEGRNEEMERVSVSYIVQPADLPRGGPHAEHLYTPHQNVAATLQGSVHGHTGPVLKRVNGSSCEGFSQMTGSSEWVGGLSPSFAATRLGGGGGD
jgi:hypothetical protein